MALKGWSMRRVRWLAATVALVVVASACTSSGNSPTSDGTQASAPEASGLDDGARSGVLPLQIPNQGGSMEGHTPRGFAGSGTGLFAGDNLNPRFPDGDGVQIWLTFDIAPGTPPPARAVLRSTALTVRGDPFSDLGSLQVEPVSYDLFSPTLFDLAPTGDAAACNRLDNDGGLECEVTDAVTRAIAAGDVRAQFRLRFQIAADNDGEADLAMFFITDSNTNEPGIFTLDLR